MWNKFSERAKNIKPSAIRKFFDVPADVISLGVGEPDFDASGPTINAGIDALKTGKTHYTSSFGVFELRETISQHLYKKYGVYYHPEKEILITVGASEGLYLAVASLINPGDEMIVITPCFVSYQGAIILASGKPVEVACKFEDNFDVDLKAVEAAITPRTKGILLGFPSNPTGKVASRETIEALCDLALKYDLAIISDEIYDQLVYGVQHVCIPAIERIYDRTILLGGFSKAYAMTGFRIGYVAAPAEIIEGPFKMHQYLIMSAPSISQHAAIAAMRDTQEDVDRMVAEYDRRRKLVVKGMKEIGLDMVEPKGAFYAFPKISNTGLDCDTFATRLLKEEKVALIPGAGFGPGGEECVRISYATSYEKNEQALQRIDRFVNRL